jgi:hypothetical protein
MKMRKAMLLLFWLCVLGTIVRLPLLCYEFWLLATATTFSDLTVWSLLTEHLPFLAWVTDLITAIFGAEFGGWILDLPATLVTSVKLVFGTLIGIWALDTAREINSAQISDEPVDSPG